MCNMWWYGHKLRNTHAHGIDENYLDFHLCAQLLQPTAYSLPACIVSQSELLALYCQVQSSVVRMWWSGGQHPGWAGVPSSRIRLILHERSKRGS